MMRVLRDRWRLCVGLVGMAALAGCAGQYLAQREPWRKDAEIACLKSGAVRETGTLVRIEPINGPGMCGADFPLKVAAFGDNTLLGYSEALRPPGSVPNAGPQRWPSGPEPRSEPYYAPPPSAPPQQTFPGEQQYSNPMRAPAQRQQTYQPPTYQQPTYQQPTYQSPTYQSPSAAAPMPITPPSSGGYYDRAGSPEAQSESWRSQPQRRASVYDAPSARDDDPPLQTQRAVPPPSQPRQPPFRGMASAAPVSVPLGRQQGIAAVGPVEIKPAATLACPMVSALDRWIADSLQPAAQRWFRQPVVEIRQISAYSCRGMNGQPGARISEHAFGNALDIAAFTLADGRKVTVKDSWRGSPEEQGFLRDIQGAACEQFNTVLAPGSNRFHYDHFHFDLMRRASGHRICNPDAIPGDVVAARVAKDRGYAYRPDSGVTGAVANTRRASLGGRPKSKSKTRNILSADDDDWIEDEGPRPVH